MKVLLQWFCNYSWTIYWIQSYLLIAPHYNSNHSWWIKLFPDVLVIKEILARTTCNNKLIKSSCLANWEIAVCNGSSWVLENRFVDSYQDWLILLCVLQHLVHQFQSDPDIQVAILSILAAGVVGGGKIFNIHDDKILCL